MLELILTDWFSIRTHEYMYIYYQLVYLSFDGIFKFPFKFTCIKTRNDILFIHMYRHTYIYIPYMATHPRNRWSLKWETGKALGIGSSGKPLYWWEQWLYIHRLRRSMQGLKLTKRSRKYQFYQNRNMELVRINITGLNFLVPIFLSF